MPPVNPPPPEVVDVGERLYPVLVALGGMLAAFWAGLTRVWEKLSRKEKPTPSIAPPLPRPLPSLDDTMDEKAQLSAIYRAVTMNDPDGNRVSAVRYLLEKQTAMFNERFSQMALGMDVMVQANADSNMAQARMLETIDRMLPSLRDSQEASHLTTEALRLVVRDFRAAVEEEEKKNGH